MKRTAWDPRLDGRVLVALVLVLPFEPRYPILPLFRVQFTFLELAAAAATTGLAWSVRRRLGALLRHPPLPVACLAAFALVHFLSALAAPAHRGAAAVFSLRMAAAAAFGAVTAACPRADVRRGLSALAPMAGIVAVLAILEGIGVRALDPFLNLFRAIPYAFEGSRRASAAAENPNLAAALLVDGLVAGAGFAAVAQAPVCRAIALALPISLGLLLTYSRGGLLGALAGVGVVCWALRPTRRGPLAVAGTLVAMTIGLAVAHPAFRSRIALERLASAHQARYEPLDAALILQPGETRVVSVRVVNTGTQTWQPEAYRVGCVWFGHGRFLDAGRVSPLPAPVAPGQSVIVTAGARAPVAEGSYILIWDMVGELGQFSARGIPPGRVPAAVGGLGRASLPSEIPSFVSRRTRWELWKLAWRMWRARPLLGYGPDSYRKLHAGFGDWSPERGNPGDHAHSAYLEAAACTGSLGLLALVATLLTSLASARRAMVRALAPEERMPAAVVMGLLAAIATQGTVDYLLGFTAQYLLFAFVVGASAALEAPRDIT